MKSTILSSVLTLAALLSVHVVVAQNPHYVKGPTIRYQGTQVCFGGAKIAGLGSSQTYYLCVSQGSTASGTVTCTNNGGQVVENKGQSLDFSTFTPQAFQTTRSGQFSLTSWCITATISGNPCDFNNNGRTDDNWQPTLTGIDAGSFCGQFFVSTNQGCTNPVEGLVVPFNGTSCQ